MTFTTVVMIYKSVWTGKWMFNTLSDELLIYESAEVIHQNYDSLHNKNWFPAELTVEIVA